MRVNGHPQRTIWTDPEDPHAVFIIDQRWLPHRFEGVALRTADEAALAIRDMWVRGAPLIGATAAYGIYLATLEASHAPDPDARLRQAAEMLAATRPTAVNLNWAIQQQLGRLLPVRDPLERVSLSREIADHIAEADVESCRMIGIHGLPLLQELSSKKKGARINILTHCNAGWLATVDWGTATSPIYHAFEKGIDLHVWVDETRPRNQGASLTAWELQEHGIAHTVIPDNTGGHLMQHGMVDICIVGTDRTTRTGDVANKIGTYLKALAANDNGVPFYVALPSTTIDWKLRDGLSEIPIETRNPEEVTHIQGWDAEAAEIRKIRLTPNGSPALNYGFDVTPARLISGLITERGICPPTEEGLLGLFPEMRA